GPASLAPAPRHALDRPSARPDAPVAPRPRRALPFGIPVADPHDGDGFAVAPVALVLVLFGALVVGLGYAGRRAGLRPAPTINGDALLRDDTDLLRQLDADPRSRLHDDR